MAEIKMTNAVRSYLAKLRKELKDQVAGMPTMADLQKVLDAVQALQLAKPVIQEIPVRVCRYLFVGRVKLPAPGLALPASHSFHNYVEVRAQDSVTDAGAVAPTEEEILAQLREIADRDFPGHQGVVIHDISVLPASWRVDEAAEEE